VNKLRHCRAAILDLAILSAEARRAGRRLKPPVAKELGQGGVESMPHFGISRDCKKAQLAMLFTSGLRLWGRLFILSKYMIYIR
jgi:hypothetical protein